MQLCTKTDLKILPRSVLSFSGTPVDGKNIKKQKCHGTDLGNMILLHFEVCKNKQYFSKICKNNLKTHLTFQVVFCFKLYNYCNLSSSNTTQDEYCL